MTRGRTAQGRVFLPGEGQVRDALLAVGLAAARRHRRRLPDTAFVGVTGSAAKTTTKDLIAAVLGTQWSGTKTPGSENRLATLGRTILRTRPRDGFCVAEIPAWEPGSVAEFTRLVRPDVGVVTRIGSEHRTVFRTNEATAAEKSALVAGVAPDGAVVLNADDPHVIAMQDGFRGRVVTFGTSPDATLRAEDVTGSWPDPLRFTLRADGRSLPVRTRFNGRHWTTAVLAALGVATALDVPLERAAEAVASFEPVPGRMNRVDVDGITFLRDDAKAPLWSLEALFELVADARVPRKVLVLGTISDYPGSSTKAYQRVAERALEVADEVVFVGPKARHALRARTGRPLAFATVREATEHFRDALQEGDLVVLKGSKKADHLGRILLDRTTTVRCWRTRCGRVTFCEDCRLLRIPASR